MPTGRIPSGAKAAESDDDDDEWKSDPHTVSLRDQAGVTRFCSVYKTSTRMSKSTKKLKY